MIRLLKKCLMPLAILLILMAIFFSLFRALTPWAKQYKGKVEQHLSTLLGQPVTINDMETSWYWFEPVLKLNDVVLSDQKDHILKFNKLLVGIDLFSSLWHWQIKPGVLYVEDAHITLRQVKEHWDVDGLNNKKQSVTFDSNSYLPILSWIFSQEKIIIKHVSAKIYFSDGTFIPLQDLNVTAFNSYGHYRVKGSAKLDQKTPTELSVIADLQLDPFALNKAIAHAYVSIQHIVPSQWQVFFPDTAIRVKGGEGDIELWLDVDKGHLTSLQSTFDLNQLHWTQKGKSKRHYLQSAHANLAWKQTKTGWTFSGDKINLFIDGLMWPENEVLLDYQQTDDRFQGFIKHLSIQSLLSTDVVFPQQLQSAMAMSPQGELHDTQVIIKSNQLDYVLTRFSNFGWTGHDKIPSIHHLSGVVDWQPAEGRLELDGKNTTVKMLDLPEVTFEQVNAAFDWKTLSNGIRVSMDRLVLSRPDLVFTAQGSLDDLLQSSANLRMEAQFSATDAKQWMQYIPSQGLKPKLDSWLKQDIKKIDKASGRISVNGLLADFPFDKAPGEFSINSYLSGVDLSITSRWPLTREIDAHLTVNHRTMDVAIEHAFLKDVLVDKLSLVIDDIGLGHEALLIHTDVHAIASQLKDFVYASPVGARFLKWKNIDISDALNLDLRLEVPLYPESDHVFVRGSLGLDNNQLTYHYAEKKKINLDKLAGNLTFDEYSVTAGEVQGAFAGDPVAIHLQSYRKPKAYTEINVEASTNIQTLRDTFSLPILSLMEGHTSVQGLFTITDNPNDLDHLRIQTSMAGVAVDLPPPLGKKRKAVAPLTIDVDFNGDKNRQLRFAYQDIFILANKITPDDWSVKLKQKDVTADLHYKPSLHQVSGSIDKLDLSNLLSIKKQMKASTASFQPNDIPNLDITIQDFKLNNIDAGQVNLKSTSTPTKWVLDYFNLKTPEYLLTVQGYWERLGRKDNTSLEADLQMSDLGKTLARWKIAPAVDAKRSNVKFKGGWPGPLFDFSLEKVTGDMYILVRDGRITHLDKGTEEKLGLGKLLSILSLQTIPRRLKLDFSDLSEDGYSFDEFKGNFTLNNGVMNTQDSYIDGPVAYASMKGDLDIVKQLYDVDLRVSPYITASLPIVATIAGGPIAGIATWAASKIINKGMQQISAYTYKVSGPWLDPVVQQVRIYRKNPKPVAP